ncbi:UNVERIFIED_CONTAM: hypothetical protein Sradi_2945000 [Sesamum radiatum]|uniref:Neprosin PEP catalytic domain-containing protein n=1 Tax=Sesamum radiatum TaxID=300843 RepID=A0AAW2S058_SESRA
MKGRKEHWKPGTEESKFNSNLSSDPNELFEPGICNSGPGWIRDLRIFEKNFFLFGSWRRRRQCTEKRKVFFPGRRYRNALKMSAGYCSVSPIVSALVFFLFFVSSVCPARSVVFNDSSQSFRPGHESKKLKLIFNQLFSVAQSPDGDIIDCVLSHNQPAFDHPQLKGQKPLDPPDRPTGHLPRTAMFEENFQVWSMSNEFCPEGTVPIRRTKEDDVLRASSIRRFGKKIRPVRRDSSSNGHEVHLVMISTPLKLVGRHVSTCFSKNSKGVNAIFCSVSPELYGDNYPRFFTYWTTNNKIAIGAAISPTSSYNGGQFDISLLVWKDPKHGNWWLEFGDGILVGYWPSFLFTHLRDHASMVQFGGEIVNSEGSGSHTSTQMGSGHFAEEGFGKASYFRNLQVVDWDNNLVPLSNLRVLADHPNCYDIQGGVNRVWGNYFYYGGPGKNPKCP